MRDLNCPDCRVITSGDCGKHYNMQSSPDIEKKVEEVWNIVKNDSQASVKIGSPSFTTRKKLHQALQEMYELGQRSQIEKPDGNLSLREAKMFYVGRMEGRADMKKRILEKVLRMGESIILETEYWSGARDIVKSIAGKINSIEPKDL